MPAEETSGVSRTVGAADLRHLGASSPFTQERAMMKDQKKRILGYQFARELSREELEKVSGGRRADTGTKVTTGDDRHTTPDTVTGDH